MRISSTIILSLLLLAGCVTSHRRFINEDQAQTLAIQLANVKAELLYQVHPFRDDDAPAAFFITGHWVWSCTRGAGHEDIQARVDLAFDGSTNNVDIKLLGSKDISSP